MAYFLINLILKILIGFLTKGSWHPRAFHKGGEGDGEGERDEIIHEQGKGEVWRIQGRQEDVSKIVLKVGARNSFTCIPQKWTCKNEAKTQKVSFYT